MRARLAGRRILVLGVALAAAACSPTSPTTSTSPEPPALVATMPASASLAAPGSTSTPLATSAPTSQPSGVATGGGETALDLLATLQTAAEHNAGYKRSYFVLWTDADHDGCDTRQEVLIAESTTPVTEGKRCSISGGSWYSAYDGVKTTRASTFDIDHLVPLAEAWGSGASAWSAERRMEYANDLGDPRTLIAVSATSNRAKGDRDPATWLPPLVSYRCTYVTDWVVVKTRWSLSVDQAERSAIEGVLDACPPEVVSVVVEPGPISSPTVAAPSGTPGGTAEPSAKPTGFYTPPGWDGHSDVDCGDFDTRAHAQSFFLGTGGSTTNDPYRLDADHDGQACESLP